MKDDSVVLTPEELKQIEVDVYGALIASIKAVVDSERSIKEKIDAINKYSTEAQFDLWLFLGRSQEVEKRKQLDTYEI